MCSRVKCSLYLYTLFHVATRSISASTREKYLFYIKLKKNLSNTIIKMANLKFDQPICELENRIQISFIFIYIRTNYHMNILCQNRVSLGIVRQVDICLLQLCSKTGGETFRPATLAKTSKRKSPLRNAFTPCLP